MTEWEAFAGITGVVLLLLLVLSHLTTTAFDRADVPSRGRSSPPERDFSSHGPPEHDASRDHALEESLREVDERGAGDEYDAAEVERTERGEADYRSLENPVRRGEHAPVRSLSTAELLANVALSQGLFAGVLVGAVIYTGIPADALGIDFTREYLLTGVGVGTALGVVLYVANELGAASAKRFGIDHDEQLREMLAPDSIGGWLVLLLAVLPIIAVFEELLFRAALIGALSAGFDLSPWLLAVGSSIAFGFGHGIQGTAGVVVTGVLGFVLAAAYIYTGSLLVVVVAHYLINGLEFVVHEGLDLEWAETAGG